MAKIMPVASADLVVAMIATVTGLRLTFMFSSELYVS